MSIPAFLDGEERDLRETIAALSQYIERSAEEARTDDQIGELVQSALLQRGSALLLLKDHAAAQSDFHRILENPCTDAIWRKAHLLLGATYAEGGHDEQALACWTEALEAFARDYQAEQALPAQEIAPLYRYRAMMRGRLQQYQEAVSDCDRALEWDPSDAEALSVRGISRAFLGDLDQALADCAQAVEKAPQVEHLSRLGEVYLLRQEYQRAFEILNQAVSLDPANERVVRQRTRARLGYLLPEQEAPLPSTDETHTGETSSCPTASPAEARHPSPFVK
jgi:tetratricopeptide (TPR) repeat protein